MEKASGEQVLLREYLEQVWAAVAKQAIDTIFKGAETRGFEQDARLTAIWFWAMKEANGNDSQQRDAKEAKSGGSSGNGATNDVAEDEAEEEVGAAKNGHGYAMEFDAARKLAQGLGADLAELAKPGGVLALHGNIATLLSVSRREDGLIGRQKALFGGVGSTHNGRTRKQAVLRTVAGRKAALFDPEPAIAVDPSSPFLPGLEPPKDTRSLMRRLVDNGATTLDRLHQVMILFGRGQTPLIKPLLAETGMGQSDRFWTLAQALSALYPAGTDEKRWVDGVLARKKGLGF